MGQDGNTSFKKSSSRCVIVFYNTGFNKQFSIDLVKTIKTININTEINYLNTKKKIEHTMVGNSLLEMLATELSLAFAILSKELLSSKHSTPSRLGSNNLELFEIMLELQPISSISSTFCLSLECKFVVISG